MEPHPLKVLRDALRVSQAELASVAGVSAGRISQVENRVPDGKNGSPARLGPEPALRIAEQYRDRINQLGITVEDLLRGSRNRAAGTHAA